MPIYIVGVRRTEKGHQSLKEFSSVMDRAAKILGACWMAIGVVYYLVLMFRSKRPVALET